MPSTALLAACPPFLDFFVGIPVGLASFLCNLYFVSQTGHYVVRPNRSINQYPSCCMTCEQNYDSEEAYLHEFKLIF